MSVVEARDYVLWPKHIHGNPRLRDELLALDAGALITLEVDGVVGTWVKMDDGKHGAPTPGLKALGMARKHWHGLFKANRGAVVSIMKSSAPPGLTTPPSASRERLHALPQPIHGPSDHSSRDR